MPNCRHGVKYSYPIGAGSYRTGDGCTSRKQPAKSQETSDKVKCAPCNGPWKDDAKAKQTCPFHDAYRD